ncbi:hypothetical protein BDK51DRAFT_38549 [Blyttiomyces helicus]|uniref:Uncharacterized protein n=1 Tax=Blyttiomyces helicus TaxID=388810 RepID=A0A4P9VZ31_9FUNG|nr:hypothetical protein BDK51DRAFT_38549 [Blyttiomyces helicus]|eukprot:RKO84033.1 hypothetical protein BDK51DRAFT_38549 [Blyttiomyces helicus]
MSTTEAPAARRLTTVAGLDPKQKNHPTSEQKVRSNRVVAPGLAAGQHLALGGRGRDRGRGPKRLRALGGEARERVVAACGLGRDGLDGGAGDLAQGGGNRGGEDRGGGEREDEDEGVQLISGLSVSSSGCRWPWSNATPSNADGWNFTWDFAPLFLHLQVSQEFNDLRLYGLRLPSAAVIPSVLAHMSLETSNHSFHLQTSAKCHQTERRKDYKPLQLLYYMHHQAQDRDGQDGKLLSQSKPSITRPRPLPVRESEGSFHKRGG